MRTVLELIGWVGSALIVLSVMQARVLRFRILNFAGSLIATAYNAILGIWPFVAMNAVIAGISLYWIRRLTRERHDPGAYAVIPVPADDPYLAHVLALNGQDIARHQPDFEPAPTPGRSTFLVLRGDEPVGIVAVRPEGDGVGLVELDWVKPRFRDFTPGEFVYRDAGELAAAGYRRVEVLTHEALDREYLRAVGFRTEKARWVREIVA